MKLPELTQGLELPPLQKLVTQEQVNLYAEASGDHNPIHLDESFASKTAFGGRVAHGMLILAYISELMTASFGRHWLSNGRLDVRFKSAARPGDTINVSGRIIKVEKSGASAAITCSVLCSNQKDEAIITGEALVTLPEAWSVSS